MDETTQNYLRLWLRLLKVTRGVEAQLRERLRVDHQTTLPRFDVKAALRRFPDGLRMSELSAVLKVSNGNVTGIIERLVEEGLAQREQVAGDRRAFLVKLTDKGRELFDLQAARHATWVEGQLGALSQDEVQALLTLLERVSDHQDQDQNTGSAPV